MLHSTITGVFFFVTEQICSQRVTNYQYYAKIFCIFQRLYGLLPPYQATLGKGGDLTN